MSIPRKVLDILPPEKSSNPRPQIKEVKEAAILTKPQNQNKVSDPISEETEHKVKKNSFKRFLVFFIIFVVLFFLASQFLFANAEIKIWPETEVVNLEEKITISTETNDISLDSSIVPGKLFTANQTALKTFQATGKATKEVKAQGTIRIYNNYSTSPQTLVATTRLISADGKLFRTTEKVVVPGAILVNGKLQPSYIDAKVAADQAGESYNVEPTKFSIPGFVGTAKYTAFYGESLEKMTGGYLGETPQVTQEDLDNADKDVTEKALAEGETSLKNKISSEFSIIREAISSEILEATSSAKAGAEVSSFSYQVKVTVKTIAYKSSDFFSLLGQDIVFKKSEGKSLQEESLTNSEPELFSMDMDNGKIIVKTEVSAKIYSSVDESQIKESLKGSSLVKAKEFLSDQSGITKVQIKSWPFWTDSIPEDSERIKLNLILD
jgi:hypothetical protein